MKKRLVNKLRAKARLFTGFHPLSCFGLKGDLGRRTSQALCQPRVNLQFGGHKGLLRTLIEKIVTETIVRLQLGELRQTVSYQAVANFHFLGIAEYLKPSALKRQVKRSTVLVKETKALKVKMVIEPVGAKGTAEEDLSFAAE